MSGAFYKVFSVQSNKKNSMTFYCAEKYTVEKKKKERC